MRVAVLADIHGNLPACEAVLEDIARVAPDYIVAAGDLALRGAHPKETVELLFDRCDALLMGNTDCYLAGNYLGGAYRERDHWKTELLRWTRDQLGESLLQRLGAMPFSVRYTPRKGQDLFVCHANPKNLEESLDPTLDDVAVRRFFQHLDAAACAFGHLHFPYRRRVGRLLIADVASAGIPRDGDLRPAYGVFTFTPKGWRVQIRRVRYPVRKATQAITARRVPGGPLLIHKLVEARYRHHAALMEAARRHSGLPPMAFPHHRGPPPGHGRHAAPLAPCDLPVGAVDPASLLHGGLHDDSHDDSHDASIDESGADAHAGDLSALHEGDLPGSRDLATGQDRRASGDERDP
jgi:Calcineurin-like phosphoesterase superfamily domain